MGVGGGRRMMLHHGSHERLTMTHEYKTHFRIQTIHNKHSKKTQKEMSQASSSTAAPATTGTVAPTTPTAEAFLSTAPIPAV